MDNNKKLLDVLNVYSDYDKETHSKLKFSIVDAVTKKAALIDGEWVPLSQMKCDVDGNLYVANWLWEKLKCE